MPIFGERYLQGPAADADVKAKPGKFKMKQMGLLFSAMTTNPFKTTTKALWQRG